MNQTVYQFLRVVLLMLGTLGAAYSQTPDTFSPVVSFLYQDSLDEPGSNTVITSPVVSFLYEEWAGDDVLTLRNSLPVSYFFKDGITLSTAGTVRTPAGVSVAGAFITLKRAGALFWQGTSGADGTFITPGLTVSNYTVAVTCAGYLTSVQNVMGSGSGLQRLDLRLDPLPAAPTTVATDRQPTTDETTPPVPAGDAPGMKVFDGVNFVAGGTIYTDRMTIVLTHGMNSSPAEWAASLAVLIRDHHVSQMPNIVAWDWQSLAAGSGPFQVIPPVDNAATQGLALGKVLYQTLTSSYGERLHFIGHSLGTIVNRYACDYVHGSLTGSLSRDNPPTGWLQSQTQPHVTMLDEAEVASIFGTSVLTSAATAGKVALVTSKNLLVATAVAGAAGSVAARKDWKYPIPVNAQWVDNYISAFGFQRVDAVNVCLPAEALASGNPVTAHSYAHLWYRSTVNPPGGDSIASIGYASSREGSGVFPPTGNGRTSGSLWYENLATSDSQDLSLVDSASSYEASIGLLSLFAVVGTSDALDATGRNVLAQSQAAIKWAENIGGTVIYESGQVASGIGEKLGSFWDASIDAGTDILNSIEPDSSLAGPLNAPVFSILLSTSVTPQLGQDDQQPLAPNLAPASPVQPACAWLTVNVPANAGMMAFDFTVTGDPMDDFIACAVNGQNMFSLPAKFAPDGSPVSTDMMDISDYAGQSVELFFGLVGGTSTNCQVTIDGIRFITIPNPVIGIKDSGANVLLEWPAATTGWMLESSDTMVSGSWQPVSTSGTVSVTSGIACFPHPKTSLKRFFRLRRMQ